ncbi:MAG: methylmalonyl-CoA mutase family protein [Oligoflexales bacterium]|nr:methylmalonyl-CoA mutase family protein [Oligoflexales bacterium]
MHNYSSSDIEKWKNYCPQNKIRIVTSTSLFDGHDASINIFRRLLQARGAEVIHLGHNRSAKEVAIAAIQEDVQAIAISSYQGGHMEYFKYVRHLVDEQGGKNIKIFGGGGGVITPQEISELEANGISKIFSPEDGQQLGLDGIIGHMLHSSDFNFIDWGKTPLQADAVLARSLTLAEQKSLPFDEISKDVTAKFSPETHKKIPVIGITGSGGAGKSSLTDELLLRLQFDFPDLKFALICIDPSKRKTGGALLGDRIRINSAACDNVFLRSFASRDSGKELASVTQDAVKLFKNANFDLIIVETSGIGQGNAGILEVSDLSLYVMTPEFGAASQLEKIDMLDFADLVAINKFERAQGLDAIRDVRTLMRRNRFKGAPQKEEDYPVFGTIASRFNDDGVNGLYKALLNRINHFLKSEKFSSQTKRIERMTSSFRESLIPSERLHYLNQIARQVREYHQETNRLIELQKKASALKISATELKSENIEVSRNLEQHAIRIHQKIPADLSEKMNNWPAIRQSYSQDEYTYKVRDKMLNAPASFTSLSERKYAKVAVPNFQSEAELLRFLRYENLPGEFPFTAGIFPFRRQGEDPKRQFAGEGGPGRTNKRFHYLCKDDDAKRLSTAFDSVTLYGADPEVRPDIYGKVGESGVSIASLDDIKLLYSGFDLCAENTSVSMTINGPAPIILAMFLNAAIDQKIDEFIEKNSRAPSKDEHQKIYDETLQTVRGTVQADILKEDQAQNTCIFSTEFALKLMADIQAYFIDKKVRNYYSVSISGYHIAEAGANPITQLAFTLANGFTYVEYYLAKGLKIDDFAPNLSFFFSNGLDPEYSVIGRVARRIWAIAMKNIYNANERSQKLKYHIQTSGRSLHAQEIDFNDIRTTLQALIALMDNCNSLHTNAYDEALTTPTEESVRRAMAIQLIINKEFGLNKCENVNQGSFYIEELTNLVEEAVLQEFENISRRGGVLGAMETQYQRNKIQEESLHYEHLKHSGEYPVVGVNTFLNPNSNTQTHRGSAELIRASYEEKDDQLQRIKSFKEAKKDKSKQALADLADAVIQHKNVFAELMHTVRYASLGEITDVLYRVGGQYRRSM